MAPDLVVGGTGRVGRMLARAWDGRGPVFQRRAPGEGLLWDPLAGPGPFIDWCDASGGCRTMVILAGVTPGAAAPPGLNAVIAEACLEAARRGRAGRVLYASSSAVYGRGSGVPLTEADAALPVTAYGAAKRDAEAVCDRFRENGVRVTVLRIGNVAGADQLLTNARRASAADPLRLDRFADGSGPRRSYVGAGTLARVLGALCAADGLPPVLNVAAPEPVSMQALLEAAHIPWTWVPAPEEAMQDLVLDCARLARIVELAPEDSRPDRLVAEWRSCGDPR